MAVVASVASRIFAIAPSLVLLGPAGCASLPPPADVSAPIERTVPALPATPTSPPPGRGLVILDSVSGPARATRIVAPPPSTVPAGVARRASGAEDQGSTLLCSTTPCAAYLPYGAREVLLESNVDVQRSATYLVDVTDRPVVLRASLDTNRPAGRGRFAGAVLLVSGLGCMAFGAMVANRDDARSDQGRDVAGWTALGVGAAVALLGGILWSSNAPVHQEGRAIQWNLEQGDLPARPVPPLP